MTHPPPDSSRRSPGAQSARSHHRGDGTFLTASPAALAVYGIAPADLVGRRMQDLIDPEDARDAEQALAEARDSTDAVAFKPKKSVALSGVTAGNTALCSVGKTGNDLHYRGYDILDIAETSEFEEIAYLLVHGKLPNAAELKAYKTALKALRGLPQVVKAALEALPAAAHPMDVMRTGVSALGCALPEKDDHNVPGAREIADRLMASFGSMLLYWSALA
jgi:hypothetical protein